MGDPRISARINNPVSLNVTFRRNGVGQAPYAIRRVDIYKESVKDENLVGQILFDLPSSSSYPAPAVEDPTQPGNFVVDFTIPAEFKEGIYFDVWRFIGAEPESLSAFDFDDESQWLAQCNKFWVFPDGWFLDDGLVTPRFGFEPLDNRFRKGEICNLEVGLMPLPLYDWDQNFIGPMIPQIRPYITVSTNEGEVLVGLEKAPCSIGLRQGSFRTNPYVIKCALNTNSFLKGTYSYKIILELPNGEVRISDPFRFTIV